MNIHKIMSELDEYKQNIPENLYIQLANLLKEQYNNEKLNTINDIENNNNENDNNSNENNNNNENIDEDTDWEEDSESEETNNEINREISTCLQIIYIPKYEAILKKSSLAIDFIVSENRVGFFEKFLICAFKSFFNAIDIIL